MGFPHPFRERRQPIWRVKPFYTLGACTIFMGISERMDFHDVRSSFVQAFDLDITKPPFLGRVQPKARTIRTINRRRSMSPRLTTSNLLYTCREKELIRGCLTHRMNQLGYPNQNNPNRPMDLIPMPSALLSCLLLTPLRGQESRQKRVGIGHRGRWQNKTAHLLPLHPISMLRVCTCA